MLRTKKRTIIEKKERKKEEITKEREKEECKGGGFSEDHKLWESDCWRKEILRVGNFLPFKKLKRKKKVQDTKQFSFS